MKLTPEEVMAAVSFEKALAAWEFSKGIGDNSE